MRDGVDWQRRGAERKFMDNILVDAVSLTWGLIPNKIATRESYRPAGLTASRRGSVISSIA